MAEFARDILLQTKSNLYYGLKCNILHDAFSLNKIGIKGENNNNLFPPQGHLTLNPFTPMSDQDRISPYNINTISSRQVMRIEKNIS